MSRLDQPPPSRYRIEEKDGRLIVHDNLNRTVVGNQFARPASPPPRAPVASGARPSALDVTARARSALEAMEKAVSTPEIARRSTAPDQEKAKRGAIVGIGAVLFLLFLVFTGLWIGLVVVLVIAPLRQAVLDRLLPSLKLYVNEGRWS